MKKQNWSLYFAAIGMLLLILDTKTAFTGMTKGIEICLSTLVPSIFPFLLVSAMLTGGLVGRSVPFIHRLGNYISMPKGTESIFLIGLLGGYPVGAQCVSQAVHNGHISRENGSRMLAFCSNAGPAFLFGIGANLVDQVWKCWLLWAIHIFSAIAIGHLTPKVHSAHAKIVSHCKISLTTALYNAVKTMALICGWVVIFRVILQFSQRWFLWMLSPKAQILFSGILELANGSCALSQIEDPQLRCRLFALFLGTGGICVTMQTASVCQGLQLRWYVIGKAAQGAISYFLAALLLSREIIFGILGIMAVCFLYYFLTRINQNSLAFFPKMLYTNKNIQRGKRHAISKKDRAPVRILHPQYTAK